jgi:hypothetical protein
MIRKLGVYRFGARGTTYRSSGVQLEQLESAVRYALWRMELQGSIRMRSAFAKPSSVVRLTPDYGGQDGATGFMGLMGLMRDGTIPVC